jgi:hypothetical protein
VDKSERPGGKGRPTPPAAGGTSAVAVSRPEQVSRPAKPALPAAGETSAAAAGAAWQAQPGRRVECPAPALVTRYLGSSVRFREVIWRIFRLCRGCGRLHHQGPGDDPGQVLLQCPDGVRVDAVRQSGQRVQRSVLQVPEEAREATAVSKRTANPKLQIDQANSKLTVIILICSDFYFLIVHFIQFHSAITL